MAAHQLPVFNTKEVYRRNGEDYAKHAYQYAFSSHSTDIGMQPDAIIYPTGDEDVMTAINYASKHGLKIAVRTGGHQVSGASSTNGDNILLDMSKTYQHDFAWNPSEQLARIPVSYSLKRMNQELGKLSLFVAHGQCSHVHVGGHAQTGGYGELGRAFGLFGDHIMKIRIITDGASGAEVREVVRGEAGQGGDLFYAVLGGSPGNFGVLTHIFLKPHHDKDHPHSRGLKLVVPCGANLKALLDIVADMATDVDLPADYDFCVSALSGGEKLLPSFGHEENLDYYMKLFHRDLFGSDDAAPRLPVPCILLYVQWSNLGGETQVYDPTFFDRIKKAAGLVHWTLLSDETPTPFSKLTRAWVFTDVREFDTPYIKRTYVTDWTEKLVTENWAEMTATQILRIARDSSTGCSVVSQIQHFGGKHSQLVNHDRKTAFSWRDATVVFSLDCFYDGKFAKQVASAWQAENDTIMKGVGGVGGAFCSNDRRLLWGTYHASLEELNMGYAWPFYHEDKAKYDKLCRIKIEVDPQSVFTPNAFCVGVPASSAKEDAVLMLSQPPEQQPTPPGGQVANGAQLTWQARQLDVAELDKVLAPELRGMRRTADEEAEVAPPAAEADSAAGGCRCC